MVNISDVLFKFTGVFSSLDVVISHMLLFTDVFSLDKHCKERSDSVKSHSEVCWTCSTFLVLSNLHEDVESFNFSLPWRHNFGCTSFKLVWLREGTD